MCCLIFVNLKELDIWEEGIPVEKGSPSDCPVGMSMCISLISDYLGNVQTTVDNVTLKKLSWIIHKSNINKEHASE